MRYRKSFLTIVLTVLMSAAVFAASANPTASVQAVIDQAIAVFKDKAIAPADREKKLRAIAESHFDFERMARSAVGLHWREFSDPQRAEFVPIFTDFIEDVVLSRVEQYSVERIEQDIESSLVHFTRESIDTPDNAIVYSDVTLANRAKPLQVNYLLKRDGDQWKIYDITIDAISVIANYRNQFNRVLNDGGYDKLVSIMRQKQQALGASMANGTSR